MIMVRSSFTSQESDFFGNMTSVPMQCFLREYPDKFAISDFLWKIHPIKGCCAADL